MTIAERFLDIVENLQIVEMGYKRRAIKEEIRNLFNPIRLHLIKLCVFGDSPHWEREISGFLFKIKKYVKNPKNGAFVSPDTAFDIAYTQPLTHRGESVKSSPYYDLIDETQDDYYSGSKGSSGYSSSSKITDLFRQNKITMKEINILDNSIKIAIKGIVFDILYNKDTIRKEDRGALRQIVSNLLEQTEELR